ncbi:MAG TPA: 2-dehydropantoate 2-reductase [Egibacteraceae bacterium]|nr:2-dehydropantoate 2-reductase [Egibacteraceae bacterium]
MKIAVYGAGGVGGYFGGRLAQAGADVWLIARGAHLQALRTDGLRAASPRGDFALQLPATDDPREVGQCDYVLLCVKSQDTEVAAARLGPLLGPGAATVSLQNGVDNEEVLSRTIGPEQVMGGVAYIFAGVESPGRIAHTAGPAKVVFGELEGRRSPRGERLLEAFEAASVQAELSEHIHEVLWAKMAFICALAGMTAAVRRPYGEIRATPSGEQMFRRLAQEVCDVAAAEGVKLPDETAQAHLDMAASLPGGVFSSLHDDLVAGRPMELEALHGAVIARARRDGVEAPMSEAIYAILEPWARRNAGSATPDPRSS